MADTGRTTFKHTTLSIGDSSNTLRTLPLRSLSVVGLAYDEQDLTAWSDNVKGILPTMPDAPIEWTGPFDNTANGAHAVLTVLNGGMTPRSLDVQFGIRSAWDAGEPQFGITQSTGNGYIVTKYTVDIANGEYSARAVLYPGSTAPAWGTAAETGS